MANSYDVIVIGGGHNGLVNAAYLARAGKKVLVLERRHVLGGAACTEEVFPGFKFSVCSYVVSLLRPEIIRDLDLPRHGLEILPLDGTFTPMPSGDYLWRVNDHGKTHREIARHSRVDAEAYDEFGKAMQAMCRFVKPILSMVPPDPTTLNPRELMKLLFIGRRFQGMSSEDKYNQVQLMTMSAIDFLDQWFETDVLKATMSASGIIGTFLGVRSPGTAYVLLHHYMGEIDGAFRAWGFARGGTGAISNAIADAAREAGVEIRTRSRRSRRSSSKMAKPKASSLANGDEIYADDRFLQRRSAPHFHQIHRSRAPSRRISRRHQPLQIPRIVRQSKYGARRAAELQMHARTGRTSSRRDVDFARVEYMERAYDDAKYGNFSRRPYIDMVIPSLTDPSVAPPGKHVMSCFVQYAPYKLRPGLNWDDQKEAFGDTVVNTIAEYAPNIKDIILHQQVITPLDLEREWGLSEGNIFQGELSLEQLFFLRPVSRLCAIPHAHQEPLHVRIGHASRRRHHGRAGTPRRSGNFERHQGSCISRWPNASATSSSSAAATTVWSRHSISPKLDSSRWCSNAESRSAAPPSPMNFIPAFAARRSRTALARFVPTSCATCSWKNTG